MQKETKHPMKRVVDLGGGGGGGSRAITYSYIIRKNCSHRFKIHFNFLFLCVILLEYSFWLLFVSVTRAVSSHKVEVNGAEIHYDKCGYGKKNVLLLPGALGMLY